ncbi:hypothetical protein BgiMline_006585 [Biomphalaria glabrata]|nr:nucleolin [Biomphalaria glabrata]
MSDPTVAESDNIETEAEKQTDEDKVTDVALDADADDEQKMDSAPNDDVNPTVEESGEESKEEMMTGDGEMQTKPESVKKDDNDEEENEDDEDEDRDPNADPNVMPQVNVSLLSKRKWQVKIFPLKCGDFMNGQIGRVFKYAKESLMYILSPGRYARGKGELYISSAKNAAQVVHNLMKLDFHSSEVNIEIIKKNDQNEVELKGFLRFDTKLVRMLCIPNVPLRRLGINRRIRHRGIGSVFVKNLPEGTTKEMLKVLFPFASEVNYNPEKFKDGTARLVLDNRNNVFNCLKAFAKVELGGNVLELHPLEKRKESNKTTEKKTENKKEAAAAAQPKVVQEEKKEAEKKEVEETKEQKTQSPEKKETKPEPKPETPKTDIKKDVVRNRRRNYWFNRRRGFYREEKKAEGPAAKPVYPKPETTPRGQRPETSSRGQQSRTDPSPRGQISRPEASPRGQLNRSVRRGPLGRDTAVNRRQNPGGSGNRSFGRNNSNWNSRSAGSRQRFGSGGSFARSGRADRFDEPGFGGGMAGGSGDMGVNAETTKEMMMLQSQLSLAIKNQIAMLNQTQFAVEQAKRSALTSDLGTGASPEVSRAFGGNKRRANQSSFSADYGEDSFSPKRQNMSLGSQQQSSWAEESEDYYALQQQQQQQQQQQLQNLYYESDRQLESSPAFGSGYNSRNSSSFGYDQSSHYRYNY